MLEYGKIYDCGTRSFIFFLIRYGWIFFTTSIILLYGSYAIYFGNLHSKTESLLLNYPELYITTGMLAEWVLLLGLSGILVGYLRARVLHRKIKFTIDEHAFHLREGLFMIKESVIPYRQISNVHLVRPYLYRLIGLSRLDIMTVSDKDILRRASGKKSADFLLPLIDTHIARELAHHLMSHATKENKPVYEEDEDLFDTGESEAENSVE